MHVLVRGMGEDTVRAPLVKLQLDCEYVSKVVEIGVVERLPVDGIDFLLGNDIAGGQVHTSPCVHVCNQPQSNEETERLLTEFPGIFPACVTTRSMALKAPNVNDTNVPTGDECFQLAGTFFENLNDLSRENQFNKNPAKNADVVKPLVLDQQHLIERQKADDQIKKLLQSVHTEQEISKIPVGYYMSKSGVLMRKWRHPEVAANEEWLVFHQIVVPSEYRAQIIQVAHDHAMSGHLGVRKTRDRILRHFFWPKLYKDFFTRVGLPREVQHDRGSNFMSGLFSEVLQTLGIRQTASSAYHPESQGALERYHQTLKNMLKTFCHESQMDWDKGIDFVVFATRETPNESTGFSPFELIYGHEVRGPLKLMKEKWLTDSPAEVNVLDYVSDLNERLHKASKLAKDNLLKSQDRMKKRFDQKSKERSFQTGEKVLVLLPVHGEPLRARFSGPYRVAKKISDVNYIIDTPGRRKSNRLCHINMLKSYHERGEDNFCVMSVVEDNGDETELLGKYLKVTKTNSEVLCNLDSKLGHLQRNEREDLKRLISSFPSILNDIPGKTSVLFHDVDVGDAKPIKQHPYRLNPSKLSWLGKKLNICLRTGLFLLVIALGLHLYY
ncbi:hypothetical protein BSL78_15768 [Apostichopus japonicus]|uniref:Integrase catalytic domain-containing protein n=1 Tax=Stichopus japonicus TaxID=307972 RepID=A0A2G8KH96_STIJA|nr:hypothetical protein BSL78_15768 [Apostichopus japonicus]